MRIHTRVLAKIKFSCWNGDETVSPTESANVIITTYADLDKHVGETVVIRGELKRLKLPSVLGVNGGLSHNPMVGHFRAPGGRHRAIQSCNLPGR